MSAQMESGTETFSVQAGNRLALSASTQAEINARTARLSSEGKMVVNVNTSMPQAFSMGVTAWRNDVVIIWQASLDSPQYQGYLYRQAVAQYQSGQYSQALTTFNKVRGYLDAASYISKCSERITTQNIAAAKARTEAADIQRVAGNDPKYALYFAAFGGGFFLLFGFVEIAQYFQDTDYYTTARTIGIVFLIIGCIILIPQIIRKVKYDRAVEKYRQEKWEKEHNSK